MSGVSLLTYADRLAGDLPGLDRLLSNELSVFTGAHVLPFFTPFDGDDTGFDPIDHTAVDPRLGSWDDIRGIAAAREVTADLIVNHVSNRSAEFEDWLARGTASPHDGMFLTFDRVFPDRASEADITAFYRPRPGLPFTPYRGADGTRRLVWTTFMPSQIDIDVTHPAGLAYLERLADTLAAGGVGTVRLDAVGYAVKTPGTDSFMTPETLDFVAQAAALIRERGMRVLVEVHAHYSQQQAIAPLVDLVYDFALPPLLLHALGTGRSDRLASWLGIRPANAVTVLDTHDGIGVIDAGPSGDRPGLLSHAEMAEVFRHAHDATGGHSSAASVIPAWLTLPHQINATFFSVLGRDTRRMLLARAVQIFLPGEPQFYYVGVLGGEDDTALFARTGQGRDVNRHVYTPDEIRRALATDVTRGQLALAALRRHPVFDGEFSWEAPDDASLLLRWRGSGHEAVLRVRFDDPDFEITLDGAAVSLTG
ncbi:alpha-amylase family glycosyl hydrolase [Microbacterium sp. QXD-8]|uniref:Alpha-amylase family glycosyl hydrolase n=1 Tax=Microbacterium psychrotolerans TaxID=3068321 RepID=A0ABU0YVP3_9MICO|nr:alpha-amylase family glycosyl hydrolase [Microbacterium sp. QXD-8]MDQ7876396.1 alpha-amylase family glycosyl hydrolase [Microbacterium sp. QXD-8]